MEGGSRGLREESAPVGIVLELRNDGALIAADDSADVGCGGGESIAEGATLDQRGRPALRGFRPKRLKVIVHVDDCEGVHWMVLLPALGSVPWVQRHHRPALALQTRTSAPESTSSCVHAMRPPTEAFECAA